MTEQMPIATNRATWAVGTADDMAPPLAPLVMPKQALTHKQGLMGRVIGLLIAGMGGLKPRFRRVG